MRDALEDFEVPEQDNDAQADSDLAETLIRLCPHLSPDLRVATYVVAPGGVSGARCIETYRPRLVTTPGASFLGKEKPAG